MSALNQEGGRYHTISPSGWFLGNSPLQADFTITKESMQDWVVPCLDAMAPFEAQCGYAPYLVEIKERLILIHDEPAQP